MKTNEYLAMIYVQSRDLSALDPGDLLMMYRDALAEINLKEDQLYQTSRGERLTTDTSLS